MGLVPSIACSYIMIYLQKRNIFAEINKFQYIEINVIKLRLEK